MKSRRVRITPTSGLEREIQVSGSLVRCKGGAWPGMRIHFADPSSQSYVGENSDVLINGQCFFGRDGKFERFWITVESAATSPEPIELEVIDCASVVVNLQNEAARGWKQHRVGGALIAEISWTGVAATDTLELYKDASTGGSGTVSDNDKASYWPRGYIGGGCSGATADYFVVVAYQHLDAAGTRKAEYARWDVNNLDYEGTYKSCTFEVGARSHFNSSGTATRNGPVLLPWPMFGLTLKVTPMVSDVTDFRWLLYERSEG